MLRTKHRTRNVLVIILALAALAATAAAALAGEPSSLVVMVEIKGNEHVPTEEILAAVKQTQIGGPLDLEAVAADQKSLFELGYFSEVPPPEFLKSLGGVKVVFHVVENPLLKELRLEGLTRMPLDEALAIFTTKPGQVINRNVLAKDLRRLMEAARDDYGLLLKSPAQSISSEGVVEIRLLEMRLRNLSFTGLQKTKPEVVRREISAKEGEIFDSKTFRKDLQNLFMLGYFESIEPKVLETGTPDLLDVQIEFKEAKTGTLQFQLSYSPADGEVAGAVKIGDQNLFGSGHKLDFGVELNQDKRNFDLTYTDPWLDANHTSLTARLYNDFDRNVAAHPLGDENEDTAVVAQETLRGLELTLGRPLAKNLTVSVGAKHQYLNREQTDAWPAPGDPDYKEPPANLLSVTPSGGVYTNSLSLRLDYRDLTPQKAKYVYVADGIKAGLSTEFAGGILGGDAQFNRYVLETAFFKSVSPRDVLALRLMGGLIDATNDPLQTANFSSGGAETLRGYDYRSFSSTQMGLANLEFRHRFNDNFEGVVFYDAGRFLTEDGWQSGSSYGLGLRVWVPYLGQIRMDYGWPTDGGSDGKFHFSIGEVF